LSNVVIFDLDGVITSEHAYWDTAGLVLHELLSSPRYWNVGGASVYHPVTTAAESRRLSRQILPEAVIVGLKARSVNSNWDTCYVGVCICLIDLLASLPDCSMLLPLQPWDEHWITSFREQLALTHVGSALPRIEGSQEDSDAREVVDQPEAHQKTSYLQERNPFHRLTDETFQGYIGLALIDRLDVYASEVLGHPIEEVFSRYSRSWKFCANLFQEWYLGDELYTQEYGHGPAQLGKPGCIHFEQPLLPIEPMRATLEALRTQGYTLGVATGRPGQEAIMPLKNYGLYDYFDEQRIVTHADVARAEAKLRSESEMTSLVKPHPYQFLRAVDPTYRPGHLLPQRGSFVVVGDTTSDVLGGHAAGALMIAVLTGASTAEARTLLEESQPDFIVKDMTHVPALLAQIDDLATIQRLQFGERAKAELLLQRWFALHMHLNTESVTLTPKPVSLNSFNGIYRASGEDYFFKTHVEEQGILEEYYNAELLHQAGYNIVRPLRTLHEKGQQMVIYPVVQQPVMFDLMRAVETGQGGDVTLDMLVAAEKRECERLLEIYQSTLRPSTAEEHAQAPIHQLFWHRLTGGRLKQFYEGKCIFFPEPKDPRDAEGGLSFETIAGYSWCINGSTITGKYRTLGDIIERAKVVLNPARAAHTVIGHGDAHFGNVFLEDQQRYLYFDPAFAGRHSPLLDIIKPIFHNVFATWMYFAQDVARDLELSVEVRGNSLIVFHNYELSAVRRAILSTKFQYFRPLITMLREAHALPDDWSEQMKLALMCCPLLTVNLLDQQRFPPAVCWLGLSQVMQMATCSRLPPS